MLENRHQSWQRFCQTNSESVLHAAVTLELTRYVDRSNIIERARGPAYSAHIDSECGKADTTVPTKRAVSGDDQ